MSAGNRTSSELVDRLRDGGPLGPTQAGLEAADTIESLQAEVERLRTATRLVLQGISDEMSACTESFTGQARYTGLLDAKQRVKRTFEATS